MPDGLEDWLRERFLRHHTNADVVRQDLIAEKDVAVSLRTLQRAVQPYRHAQKAETLATVRFETLMLLCELEMARKDHRRIDMALKLAHFPAVN